MDHLNRVLSSIAVLVVVLSATCLAGQAEVRETFVTLDGKKAVLYKDGRLVFYDGVGKDAKVVKQCECKGDIVKVSPRGRYFATSSSGVAPKVDIRIYDRSGKLVGEFTNNNHYSLRDVSDTGPLVGLGFVGYDVPEMYASRLYDVDGKLLYNAAGEGGGGCVKLAGDGTPIAFSVEDKADKATLVKLDMKGHVVARHTLRPGLSVEALIAPGANGPVCVLHKTKKTIFADTLMIWHPEGDDTEEIVIADKKLGVVQPGMEMSPNGRFAVIRIGGKGVMLYDTSKRKIVYKKAINATAGKTPVRNYLENAVNNDGEVMLLGVYVDASEKYCDTYTLLDQKGEVVRSGRLEESGGEREIRLMDDGSFALRSRIIKGTAGSAKAPG